MFCLLWRKLIRLGEIYCENKGAPKANGGHYLVRWTKASHPKKFFLDNGYNIRPLCTNAYTAYYYTLSSKQRMVMVRIQRSLTGLGIRDRNLFGGALSLGWLWLERVDPNRPWVGSAVVPCNAIDCQLQWYTWRDCVAMDGWWGIYMKNSIHRSEKEKQYTRCRSWEPDIPFKATSSLALLLTWRSGRSKTTESSTTMNLQRRPF
jgi:hypothetical protein